jgi:hypothetical protein
MTAESVASLSPALSRTESYKPDLAGLGSIAIEEASGAASPVTAGAGVAAGCLAGLTCPATNRG